tara:strand:- start:274 stop:405 length:132 start_codon:yes stop_codon:yes gene_type:complete
MKGNMDIAKRNKQVGKIKRVFSIFSLFIQAPKKLLGHYINAQV